MAVFIRKAGSPVPRNAFSEGFWIEDGRIRNIWTAMYYPGPIAHIPGMGGHSMISTESPGKIVKCGWFSNIRAASSWLSA